MHAGLRLRVAWDRCRRGGVGVRHSIAGRLVVNALRENMYLDLEGEGGGAWLKLLIE